MSFGVYAKIVSHILTDSEKAVEISKKIEEGLDKFIKSVYGDSNKNWLSYTHNNEDGVDEITAEFYEIISGDLNLTINRILADIEELDNGSYGMYMADSDFGVMAYVSYGNAEFNEISLSDAKGFNWVTDTDFCMEKVFKESDIADILECDAEDIYDEVDDNPEILIEKLVPQKIKDIISDFDKEPFAGVEADEVVDGLILSFVFNDGKFSTEELEALKDAFSDESLEGWSFCLGVSEGKENALICPEKNAVLKFKAYDGNFDVLKVFELRNS